MTKRKPANMDRFTKCNNSHLYELLDSECFIQLVCYNPKITVYERADYNYQQYEWGYSDINRDTLTRQKLIEYCDLATLKARIMDGIL